MVLIVKRDEEVLITLEMMLWQSGRRLRRKCLRMYIVCYVSGGSDILQDLVAGFRYHIFSKELPLVLKAVGHGDSLLFRKHPELLEAKIWVYFHSRKIKVQSSRRMLGSC
ncbi:hypothetical protein B296_00059007 [Ensete ventricosum]|uniref:Staygreen protein domain-containing protein n=1 Tax=Ensete ventricosum TaxID=4639 RepID=A0A426XJL1_ENSVE|nr:hypothetical protein B296_00059007 [Ensete ventricosum]